MLDSRHCEVINTHPVSQADTLVFERHIVVMIVPAENCFCTGGKYPAEHGKQADSGQVFFVFLIQFDFDFFLCEEGFLGVRNIFKKHVHKSIIFYQFLTVFSRKCQKIYLRQLYFYCDYSENAQGVTGKD